jgi:Na+/alanine symporter
MDSQLLAFLTQIRDYIWGLPLIILLVGTGVFLTIRLKGLQIRGLFYSLYLAFIKRKEDDQEKGDISQFKALMTAHAETVGRKYCLGCHSYRCGRSGGSFLDVDHRTFRDGHQIFRSGIGDKV